MANNVSLMLFMGEKVIRICDPHASFRILNLRPQLLTCMSMDSVAAQGDRGILAMLATAVLSGTMTLLGTSGNKND